MTRMAVSVSQLQNLVDYLEAHPELAQGFYARTKEGRNISRRLWTECADICNSVSPHKSTKSAKDWRLYYNEYKSKLLKKIKAIKREQNSTGKIGIDSTSIYLTPLQQRVYKILEQDIGNPLESIPRMPMPKEEKSFNGVPLPIPVAVTTQPSSSSKQSASSQNEILRLNTDALFENARATNRLAEAVERVANVWEAAMLKDGNMKMEEDSD